MNINIPNNMLDPVGDKLRALEEKLDLLQYQWNGWCVWPLIRSRVSIIYEISPYNARTQGLRRIDMYWFALHDIPTFLFPQQKRYLVSAKLTSRTEKEFGLYKDIYFDDLLLEIGNYLKIDVFNRIYFSFRKKETLIPGVMTDNIISLLSSILYLYHIRRYPNGINKLACSISNCLRKETELDKFSPQYIAGVINFFHIQKQIYSWFIRKVLPKYIFVIGENHALTAAAKEQGICVIEFQHGMIDRFHRSYNWSVYALPYKPKMFIPDRIFVTGEHSRQILISRDFWDQEPRVVGSLRLDQYRRYKEDQSKSSSNECTMVLTTGIDRQRLIHFVTDFLKITDNKTRFHLIFKLHPGYDSDKTPYLEAFGDDQRVQILAGNEWPSTYELLSTASLHISINSSVHYEALALGVPTVILPLAAHEIVLPLYHAGYALLAKTPQDLLDIVNKWKSYKVPPEISEYFFKPGALENMKKELGLSQQIPT